MHVIDPLLTKQESAIVGYECAPRVPRSPRAVFSNIPLLIVFSLLAWAFIIGGCYLITKYLP